MMISSLSNLAENERLILRTATQRINDIANELVKKGKALTSEQPALQNGPSAYNSDPIMLVALVDSIVSEKRVQYRELLNVEIQTDFSLGYGLFIHSDSAAIARVISNLVNNSVEALGDQKGVIRLFFAGGDSRGVRLSIQDNGKGISPEVLARLGQPGVTYGKEGTESGSGLGVYHARRTLESFGGGLRIESQLAKGTTIHLEFPNAPAPNWFVEKLKLKSGMTLVTVDDDLSIIQIWTRRFGAILSDDQSMRHKSFSSLDQFETWSQTNKPGNVLYLVDFEFLEQKSNGLDCIERLGISDNSILVTSRYDEQPVMEKAKRIGVRMIPKGLVPFVPIDHEVEQQITIAL